MKEQIINNIITIMKASLNNLQMMQLKQALLLYLPDDSISSQKSCELDNNQLLRQFVNAKRVEGCSEKTIKYYETTIRKMLMKIGKNALRINTDNIRTYLSDYRKATKCSRANIDNLRRIASSFFAWMENEDIIMKSPVRRIHKIKSERQVKETYSDETLVALRDGCTCLRDLAMIDLLTSTGIRVSELVHLNKTDIDFEERECIVFGKGSKERPVYFDARTKVHLKNYLNSRSDDNPALFVSLQRPYARLEISGVEIRVRELGRKLCIGRVHPHKFRRTLATKAIDKGMPVEQVQKLLGHSKIETTMEYAMVDQNNVKTSHKKYLC